MTSNRLPRLDGGRMFLADGGLETTMIFDEGIELPSFASFVLLRDARGRDALTRYYTGYLELAKPHRLGFTLDTPTWRANTGWGAELGLSPEQLDAVNRDAAAFLDDLRRAHETPDTPIALCGTIGPRGDAYSHDTAMSADEAEQFHARQIAAFRDTAADFVAAFTLAYAEEAIGIVNASRAVGMPVVISFTVETDGRLPSGQPLGAAIELLDAATDGAAAYFMVNCAHPTHVAAALAGNGSWRERIGGVRPNASRKSHAELDEATELDRGDPDELGAAYRELLPALPNLRVLGGCCGTGPAHVASIYAQCFA
jgi:S-methylmethionine-dependent homocysteine/selenocysteine methylase